MKQSLLLFAVILTVQGHAQSIFPPKLYNDYEVFPNNYNSFIDSPDISWAGQAGSCAKVTFPDHPFDTCSNLYDYLIAAQNSGKLKSYITKIVNPKGFSDDSLFKQLTKNKNEFYIEVDKSYGRKDPSFFMDSLKTIQFDQVYFIQNHLLRSYIMAAAPEYKVFISTGICIGNVPCCFTAVNKNIAPSPNKNDTIVLLKTTAQVLRFDSIANTIPIKETYGMNLALTLWYDLSKGYNKAIDLRTNKVIPANDIMDYVEKRMPTYDNIAAFSFKIDREAMRDNFSEISVSQNWYYDVTKNIFYTTISDATLYAKEYDDTGVCIGDNPRIKIIFN